MTAAAMRDFVCIGGERYGERERVGLSWARVGL